jgi:hypothetical protein
MKRLVLLGIASLLTSCSTEPTAGGGIETTSGSVSGRVRVAGGSPLAGAWVDLRDDGRGQDLADTADSLGNFRFDSIPFGIWHLRARKVLADTFLAEATFSLGARSSSAVLDTLVAVPVVHIRLRLLLPSGAIAAGAGVYLADSSCFAPFDPWNNGPGPCRTRSERTDSAGVLELDDLPASTWYLAATANRILSVRQVYRLPHGGGVWQLGDLSLGTASGSWQVRRNGRPVPFACLQMGNGATSSWDEQQRVLADDSGRLWLDGRLDLYQEPWVVFQGDSLLAEGFLADSMPSNFSVDLGSAKTQRIDLSTGGPLLSDSGDPIEILSVSRLEHATPPVVPGEDFFATIGPFPATGPWDLHVSVRCHARLKDSTWMASWGGIVQHPALDSGTWANFTCEHP